MKRRCRDLAALLCCAALAVLCAGIGTSGCGRSVPPEAEGRSLVQVWTPWAGDKEDFAPVIDLFNRSQSRYFAVNTSTVHDDTRIFRALTGGTPPDVFVFWEPAFVGVVAELECIEPLDGRFKSAGLSAEDYVTGALDLGQVNGRQYALPYLLDVMALFYNRKLFREAGLDPDRPPRTLQELSEYTRRLTRIENGELTRLGFEDSTRWWPQATLGMLGAELYAPDGQPQFNDPSCLTAFVRLKELTDIQGGGQRVEAFKAGFGEYNSPAHEFLNDKSAMYLVGQWWPNNVEKYGPHLDCGVAPFPSDTNPNGRTFIGGNLMCLPKDAKEPEGGWAFIRWTQSREAQLAFCRITLGMPHTWEALESPEIRSGSRKWVLFGQMADILLHADTGFLAPSRAGKFYSNEVESALQVALRGSKPPQQTLDEAQTRVLDYWENQPQ